MKEFRSRILLIVAAVAFSVYLLYPTYADYKNNKEIKAKLVTLKDSILKVNPKITEDDLEKRLSFLEDSLVVNNETYKEDREKRIKLGLDLQGGMYLVMEVNTAKLIEKLAKDPDEAFKQVLKSANKEAKKTDEDFVSIIARKFAEKKIRLSRYFGSIREDDETIIKRLKAQEEDAVKRAIEIINNRVNQYGVSEPSIQSQGARRIIVELPGVAKEEEAKRLLQGRALLEFRLVKESNFTIPIMNKIDEVLAQSLYSTDSSDTAVNDSTSALDSLLTDQQKADDMQKKHPFYSLAWINTQSPYADAFVSAKNKAKLDNYLSRPEVKSVIPDNVQFVYSAKPEVNKNGEKIYRLYLVNSKPELTGGVIVDAQANIDPQTTSPIVTMDMNSEGAREWARITGSNIGKRCAIMLDGFIYSAPTIQGKIPSGRSQITGMGDMDEAKLLEIVLKAGALPAPVEIIEERTVGPSLGQDSIRQGLFSTVVGFLLVALFMMVYYNKAGTIADMALFFTVLFILGVLAGFHATLTLPGIAGIILTIGMAVDANVLIFERIREEMATGKTAKASIANGYQQSYSAILDSNITTFFTGIILYQFGSGPVQGFALTLMIGIVSSLFSALVITRVVFDYLVSKGAKINIG
ncbi:MAG: protein translocase subunit SecD [Chlorobi bacterium]|nr:protein translocase subunit SecD [Chlorobiota bacterium]